MIRILIGDDHAVVRRGLKVIIDEQPDMKVTAEAGDANEVLQKARLGELDLVILDISLPGRSGLDALKELKKEFPKLPVLILSVHPEDQYAIRSLMAGASGYLTKESAPQELLSAIRKTLSGGKYISPVLAEKLAGVLHVDLKGEPHESLSDREYEVFRMIGSGKSVSQIAETLKLSVKTVSTYRARVMEKMKMETNADLIRYALENKLVS